MRFNDILRQALFKACKLETTLKWKIMLSSEGGTSSLKGKQKESGEWKSNYNFRV